MSERPRLMRMPVAIVGEWDKVPSPPLALGIAETVTRVEVGMVLSGPTMEETRGQRQASFKLAAMRDGEGMVLCLGMWLRDQDGSTLDNVTLMLAEEDVRRIGVAISALFQLTPQPGGDQS